MYIHKTNGLHSKRVNKKRVADKVRLRLVVLGDSVHNGLSQLHNISFSSFSGWGFNLNIIGSKIYLRSNIV